MLHLTFISLTYSKNCLPWQPSSVWQAVIICLEKLQQGVIFHKLFIPKCFPFQWFPVTLLWSHGLCQKIIYKWKTLLRKPTHCSILVMGGAGIVATSKNKKIIDFLPSLWCYRSSNQTTLPETRSSTFYKTVLWIDGLWGMRGTDREPKINANQCEPYSMSLCMYAIQRNSKDISKNPAMALCGGC